jgi:glycopeptide antibiotics resistance protein
MNWNFNGLLKMAMLLYTLFLAYLMLFGFGRTADEFKEFQAIPFKTISDFIFFQHGFYHFFINILCNIILFIPFGFLGVIFPKLESIPYNLIFFWIGLVSMEYFQYITGRGTADVDDFLLNSLGVVVGNFILKSAMFQSLYAKFIKA